MADVVVELVESKKDEVIEKVLEQVEAKKEELSEKVDEVADTAEAAIETAADDLGKKMESIVDKLDDNVHIAKALDVLDDVIGDQLDGREISCSCFGWLVALRMSRKRRTTPPSKSEDILSTALPVLAPSVLAAEQSQSKPLPSSETDSAPRS